MRPCATRAGLRSVGPPSSSDSRPNSRQPFAPVGEETLAGSLSNTIAGRICNHFDLNGGGYTVDGACASSLLAVAHACSSLASGDLDVALAGGVDLSLDPFELVGFAKVGALAQDAMRVFDARSAGFWPGEGCGVVVLMRLEDALEQGRRVVAVIRGWGISSDGQGGITRPEVEGQLLALRRAYRRAGFGIGTVAYFEGHGTGTSVGDATELRALGSCLARDSGRRRGGRANSPAGRRIDQGQHRAHQGRRRRRGADQGRPRPRCPDPAPDDRLRATSPGADRRSARTPGLEERWALAGRPSAPGRRQCDGLRGDQCAHLVLESLARDRREGLSASEDAMLASAQDTELFLLGGATSADLRRQVDDLLAFAGRLSLSELTDLATHLAATLDQRVVRAAIVASRPSELEARLRSLRDLLDREDVGGNGNGMATKTWRGGHIDLQAGIFHGRGSLGRGSGFSSLAKGRPRPSMGVRRGDDSRRWRPSIGRPAYRRVAI